MMHRRPFLASLLGLAAARHALAGDLDEPAPDAALWRLVEAVERWGQGRPSPAPPDLTAAFLRLSTACHRFAQGLAIYLNSWNDDTRAAQAGLDELVRAMRHLLMLAERADPEWRAFIDDGALNAPDLKPWLSTVDGMSDAFHAFRRASDRFERIARRMAADAADLSNG